MTDSEWQILLVFLTGGCLIGLLGHWFDLVVSYVKGRNA